MEPRSGWRPRDGDISHAVQWYHLQMRRIPIGLTDPQHDRLRREAARRRVSVGALIRDAVDRAYPEEAAARREARLAAREAFGHYRSSAEDTSERHDDYLGQVDRW